MGYLGDKLLGNFKPPKSARIKAKIARPREKRAARPGNSEDHLAALRKCPCVVTLRMPAGVVHHLKAGTGERGTQQKSSDKWGLPLCAEAHTGADGVESVASRREPEWFAERGIASPLDLAAALWAASPNIGRMTKIILAAHGLERLPRKDKA